jgi:hypothetical protein
MTMPPEPPTPDPAEPPVGAFPAPPAPPGVVPPVLVVPPAPPPPVPPAPQLDMHCVPQSIVPAGHTQAPAVQTRPTSHALPHPPQLPTSFIVFTQKVPHVVCAHVALQVPFEQNTALAGHTLSQEPQLLGSPPRLRHSRPLTPHAPYGGVQAQ